MRVVFDTNIYISAFAIPGGNAEEAYLRAIKGHFELFISVAILTETARALQIQFDWAEDRTRQAIQSISHIATVLRPRPTCTYYETSQTTAFLNVQWPLRRNGSFPAIGTSWRSNATQAVPSCRSPTFLLRLRDRYPPGYSAGRVGFCRRTARTTHRQPLTASYTGEHSRHAP